MFAIHPLHSMQLLLVVDVRLNWGRFYLALSIKIPLDR